jgi:hypothetical protein
MERQGKQVMCWIEPETLRKLSGFFSGAVEIPIERIG